MCQNHKLQRCNMGLRAALCLLLPGEAAQAAPASPPPDSEVVPDKDMQVKEDDGVFTKVCLLRQTSIYLERAEAVYASSVSSHHPYC